MSKKVTMPTGEIVDDDPRDRTFFWKTPFNHDTNQESDRTGLYCKDESLTKQEFVEEADINNILARFAATKEPPPIAMPEHFTDTTTKLDYFTMQRRLADASALFYGLPADKRAEHLNDPTRWADAVIAATNKGDGDALDALGIDTRAERAEAAKAAQEAADKAAKAAQEAANKETKKVSKSDNGD